MPGCSSHLHWPIDGTFQHPPQVSTPSGGFHWLSTYWVLCPMDYSPPGSFVHGISRARILKWVDIYFSRGPSRPSDQTCISCIHLAGRFFTIEPPGIPGYHTHVWINRQLNLNVFVCLFIALSISKHYCQLFPVHSLLLMRVKITQFCKYVNCFNLGECIFTCLLLFSALVSKLALRKKSHVMTTYGNLGHCLPEQVGSK